jgi:hypothetical protein
MGNLVMKSMVTVLKGVASGLAHMGSNGALVGTVVDFVIDIRRIPLRSQ